MVGKPNSDSAINMELLINFWEWTTPDMMRSLVNVLKVLVVCSFTTIIWALFIVLMRISKFFIFRWFAVSYIEIFRGTPLIVQILIIFNYLPHFGIVLSSFQAAVLSLTLNAGGYLAESYRSGFQAVPIGQKEAALALGMSKIRAVIRVDIPVAFRIVMPAIGNIVVSILLTTPFIYLVGMGDLMMRANELMRMTLNWSVYAYITFIYIIIGLILSWFNYKLEKKMRLP